MLHPAVWLLVQAASIECIGLDASYLNCNVCIKKSVVEYVAHPWRKLADKDQRLGQFNLRTQTA